MATVSSPSFRGRLGAAVTHSRHSGLALTAASRRAHWQAYLLAVDPDGRLPEYERERRARHARRERMLRLAMLSAQARRERKAKT